MKENQAVRSEASYLIFRPASVATTCEAHEALIFWLLLDQAKSNGKEIHRFALNDKLMVNCYAGYTVSECRGTSPPPPFQRGECSAVSRQQTAFGVPCRGEPLCSPFFCVVSGLSERKFRKWAQINANNSLCHSEHLLLSFRTP